MEQIMIQMGNGKGRVVRKCKLRDCFTYVHGNGLCGKHYMRMKRQGNTDKRKKHVWNEGTRGICKIENCERPHSRQGYCNMHALRIDKYGTIELPKREIKICNAENCERIQHANGFCNMHDRRNKRNGKPELQPKFNNLCHICFKEATGHGFCQTHLRRYQIWGDPLKVGSTKGSKKTPEQIEVMRQNKLGKNNQWYEAKGEQHPRFGKKHTEETRLKIKESLKPILKDPKHIEKISNGQINRFNGKPENHPMYGKHQTEETKEKCKKSWTIELRDKMAIKASKQVAKYKNTDCEIKLQEMLIKENIPFITQKPFKVGNRRHNVDIFIEPNICIEADGEYWHNKPKNMERDKLVNEELKNQGMIVIRLWRNEIMKSPITCINKIRQIVWGDHSL